MLKKNRETFYASLNDYLTVESIKSNICQENEIIIRANGELLKPDGFVKSPTVLSRRDYASSFVIAAYR